LKKKQSREDEKNKLKETRCSPDDSPEMVAAKLSRTYKKWLLTKEGSELKYNEQQFVKMMNDDGAVEKLLLSKNMKNQEKSRNHRLKSSSLVEIVDECFAEASTDMMFSVFCQSLANCLGVKKLNKSKKKLVKRRVTDLIKGTHSGGPCGGGEKCSNGDALMMGGYNEDTTGFGGYDENALGAEISFEEHCADGAIHVTHKRAISFIRTVQQRSNQETYNQFMNTLVMHNKEKNSILGNWGS